MLKLKSSFESVYKKSFYFVLLFLGFIAFWEYRYGMQPCILSYLERIILGTLAILFWVSFVYHHTPFSRKMFSWVGFFTCLVGIVVVSRHLWIQQTMHNKALLYINRNQSIFSAIKQAFLEKAPECAHIYKVFWNIRLTELILFVFILFAIVCFWQQFKRI